MSDQSLSAETTTAAALHELPPSAKLVALTLRHEETLTQAQLVEETLLPRRTVRDALKRLRERELVSSRSSFLDARQKVHSLNGNPFE